MPGGLGWKICLFAFLLSECKAYISSNLNEGDHSADSRTGDTSNKDNDDSNESRAEADLAEISTNKWNKYSYGGDISDKNVRNNENGLFITITEQEKAGLGPSGPVFPPGPAKDDLYNTIIEKEKVGPSIYVTGHVKTLLNKAESVHFLLDDPEDQSALGGTVLHEDLEYLKDPTYLSREPDNEHLSISANEAGLIMPAHTAKHNNQGLTSRLIPLEEHIHLHKIPGAHNSIVCSKEGELHNIWAPNFQCMVCACLNSDGRLKPVCVSCSTCLVPPGPPAPPTPENEEICDRYPEKVLFLHPLDSCQICKCMVHSSIFFDKKKITCYVKPDCLPTPKPRPVTSTQSPWTPEPTPGPQPDNAKCAPLPAGTPFQNPLNPCQICVCTERADLFGRLDVQIECQENPQCVPPEPISPTETPEPLYLCDKYLENVIFTDPLDSCKLCKCHINMFQQQQITCVVKPECSSPKTTPSPYPGTTTFGPSPMPLPVTESCAPLPSGKPFPNPLNPCQVCICTERADLFGRHDVLIECEENPQCVVPLDIPTLPPIIVVPEPLPACKQFPENVLFPHPSDACQVCKCTGVTNFMGVPEQHINCFTKQECLPNPAPTTPSPGPELPLPLPSPPVPSTERPQPKPYDVCGNYPLNTPFNDPTDPCRLCVCTFGQPRGEPGGAPPSSALSHPSSYPRMQVQCQLKPECYPPSPEPLTTSPAPYPTPRPTPDTVSCKPLSTGIPFQNPLNPCQICVCTETVDLFKRPDVNIKCQENPQCVLPHDATTVPRMPDKPVPLPACAQLPPNVEFPHPQDPCQLCKCTAEVITCHIRLECQPLSPSTIGPPVPELLDPSLCDRYPQNVLFPLPQDACRMCKCTFERTPYGGFEKKINCFINPACSSTPTPPTPAPWPPAPPGPLPGPYPHESCTPYTPSKPFQHPWDECQVCVCREAISAERITIEVNCYTKPSCCIEPPFDVPGLPGSSSSGRNVLGPFNGNLIGPANQNFVGLTGGNLIGTSSQNFIEFSGENMIGPSDQNLIGPMGAGYIGPPNQNLIGPSGGNFIKPWGVNIIGPSDQNLIGPSERNVFEMPRDSTNVLSGQNFIEPAHGQLIEPANGNVIEITGDNNIGPSFIGPAGGNLFNPSGVNMFGPSGQNLIEPLGENMISSSGENWFRPLSGNSITPSDGYVFETVGENLIGPPDENLLESAGGNLDGHIHGNLIRPLGGNLIGPEMKPSKKFMPYGLSPHHNTAGNLYVPNSKHLLLNRNPVGSSIEIDQWRGNLNYIPSGQVREGQHHLLRLPVMTGPSFIKASDPKQQNISPDIGFREKDGSDHLSTDAPMSHEITKAEAETYSTGQKFAGNAKASALVHHHHHGSTKMRTKSARPSDDDSMDYD